MAGNAVIGALRVVLGLDSASLDKGLKDSQSKLAAFGKAVGTIAAGIGLERSMEALGRQIADTFSKGFKDADQAGKMAQKFGVAVEELTGFKHAADLSDVSLETLGKSLGKLSKTMVEAASKPTSEAANAFNALGVSVNNADGSLKSGSQVMTDIAGKFEGMKDGAGKTAAAMAIFGRSGADLIPMLNSGKTGLAEMAAEAAKLGLIIDLKTAKAAEAFNDNLTRLGKVKDGIVLTLTAKMLPALQTLSQKLIDNAKESDVVGKVSTFLIAAFEGVARGVMFAADNFGTFVRIGAIFVGAQIASTAIGMGLAFVKFAAAIRLASLATAAFNVVTSLSRTSLLVVGGLVAMATGNFDSLKDKLGELAVKVKELLPADVGNSITETLKAMGLDISSLTTDLNGFKTSTDSTGKSLKDFNFAAMGGKTALDQFLESQKKGLAAQQAELATVGMAAGAKESLRITTQALQIAQQNSIPITEAMRLKIGETALAAENLALKLQGAQLVQQNLAPGEAFRQEMENNRLALEAFGATAEQKAHVQEATAQRYGATWHQGATSVAGSLQHIGNAFGEHSKKMTMLAKVAGIAQATIAMFQAGAEALKLGFPLGIPAAATMLAQGATMIAGIQSVSTGGFMTGGSLTVPGGMGGGDRVHAMVDLEPGEQLDIWRPGQGPDPRRGAIGQAKEIIVRGMGLADLITGKQLVEILNDAIGDGSRVRLEPA